MVWYIVVMVAVVRPSVETTGPQNVNFKFEAVFGLFMRQ
jgi:hypothetical protein